MEEGYTNNIKRDQNLLCASQMAKNSVSDLDAEKILRAFGKYGKYQMISHVLLNFVHVIHSAETLIMGFIAVPPAFNCQIEQPPNAPKWEFTVVDQCNVADPNNWTIPCNIIPNARFRYNESVLHSTLNSEFNLVCHEEHWAQHASSLFMLGGMLATPILTQLSDLYGRKYTFLIPLWTTVFANLACCVAPTYGLFLFFRLLAGIGTAGFATIGFVLGCESVAVEFRSLQTIVATLTWVAGIILVGVLRIWIKNWRWLYFAISAPGLLTICYYWWLPESVHWMINHKKHTGIRRYIQRSTRMNNIEVCLLDCKSAVAESSEVKKKTIFDVIKNKQMLFHLIVQCIITIIMNMVYWGLALLSTQLSEDGYTGYFLSALVEIPAGFLAVALLVKFGRRTITFSFLLLMGISMGFAIIFPGPGKFEMIFPIAAKLFNSMVWSAQPLLLTEMAPTSVRNIFFGVVQFFGESGSVLAPYLGLLTAIHKTAPQTTVAILSIIAAMLSLTAPETKDKPMPEDFEQFDAGPVFHIRKKAKNQKSTVNHNKQNSTESQPMLPTIQEETGSTTVTPIGKDIEAA